MNSTIQRLLATFTLILSASCLTADDTPPVLIPESVTSPWLDASDNGRVELLVAVDSHGRVATVNSLSTTNKKILKACSEAIKRWKFIPAQNGGVSTLGIYEHTFVISNGQLIDPQDELLASKEEAETSPPPEPIVIEKPLPPKAKVISKKRPNLDSSLSYITGFVKLEFALSPLGNIKKIVVVDYSHPELIEPSLTAANEWRFDHAPDGSRAVTREYTTTFNYKGKRDRSLADWINSDDLDTKPVAVRFRNPDLSSVSFADGFRLSATLTVDTNGYVSDLDLENGIPESCIDEVKKAFYSWKFSPALLDGNPVNSQTTESFVITGNKAKPVVQSVDELPQAITKEEPKLRFNQSALEGYVLVSLNIDKYGNVTDAHVVESTNSKLEKPSIEASLNWKFTPGTRQNVAIESTIVIPFIYPNNEVSS